MEKFFAFRIPWIDDDEISGALICEPAVSVKDEVVLEVSLEYFTVFNGRRVP